MEFHCLGYCSAEHPSWVAEFGQGASHQVNRYSCDQRLELRPRYVTKSGKWKLGPRDLRRLGKQLSRISDAGWVLGACPEPLTCGHTTGACE